MNIQADAKAIRYSSLEVYELSLDLARLIPEIEEVSRQLSKQTPMRASAKLLEKNVQALGTQRYRLSVLSQALDNVASLYGGTEEKVGDLFTEIRMPDNRREPLSFPNFSHTNSQLQTLLYGG